MSQTKREQVISHIRFLREELREMHLGIKEDDLFPEPGELRGLMTVSYTHLTLPTKRIV